jgi:hypothetical protein
MSDNINLVITSYFGNRRQKYNNPVADLKIHYEWLHSIKHNINLVTLVCTTDSNFSKEYEVQLNKYQSSKDIKCDIIFRENQGASYGSFSHAFSKYKSQFDYYYFLEDDYAVVENHFDTNLIDQMKQDIKIGYIPAFSGRKDQMSHGSIPSGMFNAKVLQAITDKHGRFTFGSENTYWGHQGYEASQYLQAQQILNENYKIIDNLDTRRSWFFGCTDDHETIMCFEYEKFNKQIIIPTQCYLDYLQFDSQLLKYSLEYNPRLTAHYNTTTHSCSVSGLRYLSNYMKLEF